MSERATRMDVELIREGRLVPTGGAVPVLADTALSLMDENERLREVVDRLQGVMIPHPFDGEQDDTVGGGVCVVCNWYRTDSIHDDPRAGLDADEFAALADTEEGLT